MSDRINRITLIFPPSAEKRKNLADRIYRI